MNETETAKKTAKKRKRLTPLSFLIDRSAASPLVSSYRLPLPSAKPIAVAAAIADNNATPLLANQRCAVEEEGEEGAEEGAVEKEDEVAAAAAVAAISLVYAVY